MTTAADEHDIVKAERRAWADDDITIHSPGDDAPEPDDQEGDDER